MSKINTDVVHSMSKIHVFFSVLKADGIKRTLARCLSYISDVFFDKKYGTDTQSWIKLEDLSIESDNKDSGSDYIPTQALPLRKLFKELKIPEGKVFVDFGCGKGRTLLIASGFGFKELRGVEFSHELCRIADKNCELYKQQTGTNARFIIIESDVVDYDIDDDDVFFMFNPFDETVLNRLLQKIRMSLLRRKRKIWIIYRYAKYGDSIEAYREFKKMNEFDFWGSDFTVYTNTDVH